MFLELGLIKFFMNILNLCPLDSHKRLFCVGHIQNEHLEIRQSKLPNDAIDWNDYKSMTFTRAVSPNLITLKPEMDPFLK